MLINVSSRVPGFWAPKVEPRSARCQALALQIPAAVFFFFFLVAHLQLHSRSFAPNLLSSKAIRRRHRPLTMAPIALESEDHSRDAAFNKVMHGKSADSRGGFSSMLNKDPVALRVASEEYFKHWENKSAGTETAEVREASSEPLQAGYGTSLTGPGT